MTTTAPSAPAELEEFLAGLTESGKLQAALSDGTFASTVKAYAENVRKRDGEIEIQVREQVQLGLQEFMQSQGKRGGHPDLGPAGPKAKRSRADEQFGMHNPKALGSAVEGVYGESIADVLRAASPRSAQMVGPTGQRDMVARRDQALQIMNSFGSVVPADGGFLIPETLRSQLLMIALENAVVRPRATTIPMESLRVPIPAVDATSNASSVFGGVIAYWTEEGAALTESQAAFMRIVLDAKKLTAYCQVPNELISDASAFSAFLSAALPAAITWYEDDAFMNGTGVGEPTGFISCPASVNTTAVVGQGANTIVVENLAAMYARMLPASLGTAVWVANLETFPQLATMALSVGTGGAPVWLTSGGVAGAPPMSIYGRPVIFTEKAQALGTSGDISFVDLSYYLIGDRQSMQVAASEHYKFGNDLMAYRVTERIDGKPWINSAITPKRGSSTLTPFVQLSSTRT